MHVCVTTVGPWLNGLNFMVNVKTVRRGFPADQY